MTRQNSKPTKENNLNTPFFSSVDEFPMSCDGLVTNNNCHD